MMSFHCRIKEQCHRQSLDRFSSAGNYFISQILMSDFIAYGYKILSLSFLFYPITFNSFVHFLVQQRMASFCFLNFQCPFCLFFWSFWHYAVSCLWNSMIDGGTFSMGLVESPQLCLAECGYWVSNLMGALLVLCLQCVI